MLLCLDIGNTSTHWGLVDGTRAHRSGAWPTSEMSAHLPLLLDVLGKEGFDTERVAYCSVVPQASNVLESILCVAGGNRRLFQLTWRNCQGLQLRVDVPSEVGADRIAGALGAQNRYPLPAIVVDMGTAVTVDAVTEDGYVGGIIAPGIGIMTRYLHERTALLPELDPHDLAVASSLGRNTQDQMKLGCTVGFDGMVAAIIGSVERELASQGTPVRTIVGVGGSVPALSEDLRKRMRIEPDLLLLGIHEACRRADFMN